jgi:hypothetical protein
MQGDTVEIRQGSSRYVAGTVVQVLDHGFWLHTIGDSNLFIKFSRTDIHVRILNRPKPDVIELNRELRALGDDRPEPDGEPLLDPTPDPQAVEPDWLDSLSRVRAREDPGLLLDLDRIRDHVKVDDDGDKPDRLPAARLYPTMASRLTHVLTTEYVDSINELLVTGGPLDHAEVGRRLTEVVMEVLRPTLEDSDRLNDENLRLVEARGEDAEQLKLLQDQVSDYRDRIRELDQVWTELKNELDRWYAKCDEIGASRDDPEELVRRHREHAATTAKLHAQADIFGLLDAETQDRLREDLAEIAKKRRRAEAESANVVLP